MHKDKEQINGVQRFLNRWFPDREILIRSQGEVTFIPLPRRLQLTVATLALGAMGWAMASTTAAFLSGAVIASKQAEIAELHGALDTVRDSLSSAQESFLAATGNLENKHEQLAALIAHKNALTKRLEGITAELGNTQDRAQNAEIRQTALNRRVSELRDQLKNVTTGKEELEQKLTRALSQLESVTEQRNLVVANKENLPNTLDVLADRLARLKQAQELLVTQVSSQTEASLDILERVVNITGLNISELLEEPPLGGERGVGGPFIDLTPGDETEDEASLLGEKFEGQVANLEKQLNRWASVNNVMAAVPLAAPVDSYYVSSGFGKRTDPFTKRSAYHWGIDMAGNQKTPIMAAAPGKVTFAGRKGPYGRMVEIDHGFGIKTRYGHLHKILVKKGQDVDFRDRIALMGSTGRSTGPHLHYEVHFKGKPRDPRKFIKAGRYVFKK